MKIENFIIPPECKSISVEAEDNRLIIKFEPIHPNDIFCDETQQVEKIPRIGNLSIFWKTGLQSMAVISRLKDMDFKDPLNKYQATDEKWYENAIIFQDEKQYNTILNAKTILSIPKEE